ncbi:hypothetical protein HRbin39_01917 [bacterium HR39]|nr:hypothetical protein HRbin39_01917 [bacterium HR39]
MGAGQPAGARAQRRHRQRRGVVDEQRARGEALARLHHPLELLLGQPAAAELIARNAGLGREQAGRELLGRHLQREHGDHVIGMPEPLGLGPLGPRSRGVGGDGEGERRLAHAGASREDHEIRALQPAQLLVETDEAGGNAGHVALTVPGGVDDAHRVLEHVGKRAEVAAPLAALGQLEQPLFGPLHQLHGRGGGIRIEGLVDHLLAHLDEPAPQRQVVDHAGVVDDVDDHLAGAGDALEIRAAVQFRQRRIGVEQVVEGGVVGELALLDGLGADLEDAPVDGLVEVLGAQEVRHAVIELVVDEDRPQHRQLRTQIVRHGAHGGGGGEIGGELVHAAVHARPRVTGCI